MRVSFSMSLGQCGSCGMPEPGCQTGTILGQVVEVTACEYPNSSARARPLRRFVNLHRMDHNTIGYHVHIIIIKSDPHGLRCLSQNSDSM